MIFSIFRFVCTLKFQIFKYYPIITNHTSMESLFIQLSDFEKIDTYDWFCAPGSHILSKQKLLFWMWLIGTNLKIPQFCILAWFLTMHACLCWHLLHTMQLDWTHDLWHLLVSTLSCADAELSDPSASAWRLQHCTPSSKSRQEPLHGQPPARPLPALPHHHRRREQQLHQRGTHGCTFGSLFLVSFMLDTRSVPKASELPVEVRFEGRQLNFVAFWDALF